MVLFWSFKLGFRDLYWIWGVWNTGLVSKWSISCQSLLLWLLSTFLLILFSFSVSLAWGNGRMVTKFVFLQISCVFFSHELLQLRVFVSGKLWIFRFEFNSCLPLSEVVIEFKFAWYRLAIKLQKTGPSLLLWFVFVQIVVVSIFYLTPFPFLEVLRYGTTYFNPYWTGIVFWFGELFWDRGFWVLYILGKQKNWGYVDHGCV